MTHLFPGSRDPSAPPLRRPARRLHPAWRAAAGLIALTAAAVAIGLNSGVLALVAPGSPPVDTTLSATASAGRDLYLANCASCHGDQAQGSPSGPSIRGAGPALLDFMMRTGRMPLSQPNAPIQRSRAVLTADQIASVVAYVSSLGGGGPAIPDVNTSGADIARGREIFIANCAACHGAGGAGGAVGSGVVAPGLGAATPLDVAEAVVGGPPPMPKFAFDQADLDALAAYVQMLHAPASPGGISLAGLGPVPEGLVAGFVGLVALLVAARWIGAPTQNVHGRPRPAAEIPDGDADAPDEDDDA